MLQLLFVLCRCSRCPVLLVSDSLGETPSSIGSRCILRDVAFASSRIPPPREALVVLPRSCTSSDNYSCCVLAPPRSLRWLLILLSLLRVIHSPITVFLVLRTVWGAFVVVSATPIILSISVSFLAPFSSAARRPFFRARDFSAGELALRPTVLSALSALGQLLIC